MPSENTSLERRILLTRARITSGTRVNRGCGDAAAVRGQWNRHQEAMRRVLRAATTTTFCLYTWL